MAYFLALCRLAGAMWPTELRQLQYNPFLGAIDPRTLRIARGPDYVTPAWAAFIPLTALSIGLFWYAARIEGGIGPLLSACSFYAILYFGLPLVASTPDYGRPAFRKAMQIQRSAIAALCLAVASLTGAMDQVTRRGGLAIQSFIAIALIPPSIAIRMIRTAFAFLARLFRRLLSPLAYLRKLTSILAHTLFSIIVPPGRAVVSDTARVLRRVVIVFASTLSRMLTAIRSALAWTTSPIAGPAGRVTLAVGRAVWRTALQFLRVIGRAIQRAFALLGHLIADGVSTVRPLFTGILRATASIARRSFVLMRAVFLGSVGVTARLVARITLGSQSILGAAIRLSASLVRPLLVRSLSALTVLVAQVHRLGARLADWTTPAMLSIAGTILRITRLLIRGFAISAKWVFSNVGCLTRTFISIFISIASAGLSRVRGAIEWTIHSLATASKRIGAGLRRLVGAGIYSQAVLAARVERALAAGISGVVWVTRVPLPIGISFISRVVIPILGVIRRLARSLFSLIALAVARAWTTGSRLFRRLVAAIASAVSTLFVSAAQLMSRSLSLISKPLALLAPALLYVMLSILLAIGYLAAGGVYMVGKVIAFLWASLSLILRVLLDRSSPLVRRLGPTGTLLVSFAGLLLIGTACASQPGRSLRIVAGSGFSSFEPILTGFGKQNGAQITVDYLGSLDIAQRLEAGTLDYDAIWDGDSMWTSISDPHHLIKHRESIMLSPIVLGLKRPLAEKLGWVGKDVTMEEISAAAESEKLRLMMTSATQSNSGTFAYLGFLYAFAKPTDVLASADLQNPGVQARVKQLLSSINRTSESSGWLRDLFEKEYDLHDAMFNYESHIIELDQRLVASGKQPLYIVYPNPGLCIADFPFSYVDRGDPEKEKLFLELQKYLLSKDVQDQFAAKGRRTFVCGTAAQVNLQVFNPDWGVDITKGCTPLRLPSAAVIHEALNLYQTTLRKPSYTAFLLDFSGSMGQSSGMAQLKTAMHTLLDQEAVALYLLQAAPDDITLVITFDDGIIAEWTVEGNDPATLQHLDRQIQGQQTRNRTDIYLPTALALQRMKSRGIGDRLPSIILMTDGQSNTGSIAEVKSAIAETGIHVPIYGITFGDADPNQLQTLADLTSGRVFDGKKDLLSAFRKARGNN